MIAVMMTAETEDDRDRRHDDDRRRDDRHGGDRRRDDQKDHAGKMIPRDPLSIPPAMTRI